MQKLLIVQKLGASTLLTLSLLVSAGIASAATAVVVTPTNTQGWSTADTRPGGAVTYVADATAPAGTSALQLTTDLTTTAKAQYLHAANVPLASVTDMSYYTKQVSASFPGADPSYQVVSFLTGTSTGFTTLVYEPYQNPTQGAVVPGAWQQWNVAQGLFWSTRTVVCPNGTIMGSPGGPASYTLAQVKSICPNATVAGFGVNIGSNNPGYTVRTDLLSFNGTVYNFELYNTPTDKNQCKKDGYKAFTDAQGKPFANQGQCEKFVKSLKDTNENNDNQQGEHQDGINDDNSSENNN